jgi:protein Mpv17
MGSTVINSTLQAASLAGLSNGLAQIIQAYQSNKPVSPDWKSLTQFVVFSLLATPPNVLWQEHMEGKFPAEVQTEKGEKRLSKENTAVKFFVDQTIATVMNGIIFIAGIGVLKDKDTTAIWADCQRVS